MGEIMKNNQFLIPRGFLTALIALTLTGMVETAQAEEAVEKIQVTGSHIKRIQLEGPSPIQVIDNEDLKQTGYNSVSDVLRDISASSFGSPREASGDGAAGVSSVSLRGLGSNRTLVLLNGKRIAVDSADLNLLNMAAVERIEILKDGASATYGSDAIGGVVNIITKKDYQGWRFEVQQSLTELKGGEKAHINIMGGHNTDKFSGLAVLSYRDNKTIYDRDREWTKAQDIYGYSSFGNPGTYQEAGSVDADGDGVIDGEGTLYAGPNCPQDRVLTSGTSSYCMYDWSQYSTGLPELRQLSLLGDANYQLSSGLKAYSRLSYTRREVKWQYAATPHTFNIIAPNLPVLQIPTGTNLTVMYRLTELGPRQSEISSDALGILAGVSGELWATWDWTLEANWRQQKTKDRGVNGYGRRSLFKTLVDNGQYRPFDASNKGDLSSIAYVPETNDTETVYGIELKATGELMDLEYGPLSMAVGAIGTWESSKVVADEVSRTRDLIGDAVTEIDGSRNIASAYTELSALLLPTLETQLSGRIDHYSDFGSTVNPKLAVMWKARPDLLIRTSAGTGFRAPTIKEIYSEANGYPTFIDHYGCKKQKESNGGVQDRTNTPSCYPRQYFSIREKSNDLKEETSTSFNIGAIYQPTNHLSFSLDFWDIRIKNAIGLDRENVTKAEAQGLPLGQVEINRNSVDNSIQSFKSPLLNLAQANLSGLDLVSDYSFTPPLLSGFKAKFRVEGSILFNYDYTAFEGLELEDIVGDNGSPQWRHSASLNLNRKNHDFYLVAKTIAGQKKAVESLGTIPNYTEWDFQYKYSDNKYGIVTTGVKNLFGSTLPLDDTAGANQGNSTLYSDVGRYIYLNYSYEL